MKLSIKRLNLHVHKSLPIRMSPSSVGRADLTCKWIGKSGRGHQEVSKEGQGPTWSGAPMFRDWGAEGEPEMRAEIESERQGRSKVEWACQFFLPARNLEALTPREMVGSVSASLLSKGHRPSEG